MGPGNQPKSSILTLAARSVISKKDRELMQEENKLLDKYYNDYYKDTKSKKSGGSSTYSKSPPKRQSKGINVRKSSFDSIFLIQV